MQIYSLNSLLQGTGALKQGTASAQGGFTDILTALNQTEQAQGAASAVPLGGVENAGAPDTGLAASGESFTDLFGDLINNIKTTEAAAEEENRKILTGESDDTHSALIASQKAQIAVELAVAVRDKVIAAYNEVMNMQV